jgi:hypothetical protein
MLIDEEDMEFTIDVAKQEAYNAGAAAERARIVAWLRKCKNPHEENPNDDIDCAAALATGQSWGWDGAIEHSIVGIKNGAHLAPADRSGDVSSYLDNALADVAAIPEGKRTRTESYLFAAAGLAKAMVAEVDRLSGLPEVVRVAQRAVDELTAQVDQLEEQYAVCFQERQDAERALAEKWANPEMATHWAAQGAAAERSLIVAWLRSGVLYNPAAYPIFEGFDPYKLADAIESAAHIADADRSRDK